MKRAKNDADRAAMRRRKRLSKAHERKYLGGPMRVTLLPGKNWTPLFGHVAREEYSGALTSARRVNLESLRTMDAMMNALPRRNLRCSVSIPVELIRGTHDYNPLTGEMTPKARR